MATVCSYHSAQVGMKILGRVGVRADCNCDGMQVGRCMLVLTWGFGC